MRQRIRKVNKVGNGTYYTQSWKLSEYIWVNIVYYIFVYPIYLFFKYCLYVPVKWIIQKIKNK